MTNTRKWSGLAAVLAIAVFAAGWFLLIAPKRSEAADLRDQTTKQDSANAALTQKLEELKAQQADLPKQRALLAEMTSRIPVSPALPSLVRNLTAASSKTGVDLVSMAPAVPVAVTPATGVPVAPAGAAAGATLYQVPLTLEVHGGYFALEQFLNKLENQQRSLLVSGFTISSLDGEDELPGTLSITISGRVFVSPNPATSGTDASTAAVAATTTAQ